MVAESKERRRYFRVSDLVGMRYRFLTEGEKELATMAQPSSLKGLLGQIESQINVALLSLKTVNPEVAHLLDLYNQKINLAFGHGLADKTQDAEFSLRACQVNLSACGIAFPCTEFAPLNQYIAIDLTLYPNNIRLQLIAAVIACHEVDSISDGVDGENAYLIRADFVQLADADQELLVQHILRRQAQQLNEQRAQSAISK